MLDKTKPWGKPLKLKTCECACKVAKVPKAPKAPKEPKEPKCKEPVCDKCNKCEKCKKGGATCCKDDGKNSALLKALEAKVQAMLW